MKQSIDMNNRLLLTDLEKLRSFYVHSQNQPDDDMQLCEDTMVIDQIRYVFGMFPWNSSLIKAHLMHVQELDTVMLKFIATMRKHIRKHGTISWLIELLLDAQNAVITGVPGEYIPPLLRISSSHEYEQRKKSNGMQRWGGRVRLDACIEEHARTMPWYAAFVLLKWASQYDDILLNLIQTLLVYPHYGMCMIQEMGHVSGEHEPVDAGYRWALHYIQHLRDDADYLYKCDPDGGLFHTHDNDSATLADQCTQRYLYDAQHLEQAMRTMFNAPVPTSIHILMQIETNHIIPDADPWANPVYFADLARSLMGPVGAKDLIEGFEQHKVQKFEQGLKQLARLRDEVKQYGFVWLPIAHCMREELICDMHKETWRKSDEINHALMKQHVDLATIIVRRLLVNDMTMQMRAASQVISGQLNEYATCIKPLLEQDDTHFDAVS